MMHRDGSVFSSVTPADLASPDKLYTDLGAKLVVGMPFKDIATSDSLYVNMGIWEYAGVDYVMLMSRAMAIALLLLSYSIFSGVLESPNLLLSSSIITISLHYTIILITTLTSLSFTPNPNQLIQVPDRSASFLRHSCPQDFKASPRCCRWCVRRAGPVTGQPAS